MKRIFLSLLICGLCSVMMAQGINTTDRVVVKFYDEISDPIKLNETPEFCFFTVKLEGASIFYTGYEMYIHLPNGMYPVLDSNGDPYVLQANGENAIDDDIYPFTEKKTMKGTTIEYTHSVVASVQSNNVICVICTSTKSENLNATSGDLFHVFVRTSPYMKPGDVDIPIDGVILTHNEWSEQDQQNHAYSYKPTVPCGGTITGVSGECNDVPFNISATNHWSTCILPFATEIPAGVKAYTSSTSDAENIYLTEANRLEAYTPYILYCENGYSGTVSGTVDASGYPESGAVTSGNLTGAIVPQTVKNGYILQKHNDVVLFYAIEAGDSFLVPAGKCWMNIAASDAKALNCVVESNETAIQNVVGADNKNIIYDLTGRRISTMKQGGLYIKNGEKYMSK